MQTQQQLLQQCKLQLEYLNSRFGEMETTNDLLAKIKLVLNEPSSQGITWEIYDNLHTEMISGKISYCKGNIE